MAIAQKLAGYSLGQADLLRRAMGKKKKAELDKQFETFSAGMRERGYSDRRDQDAVGHPACRSPTTPSTRRTPRPTGWCRTGPPTSRRTTRPSTWPRCSRPSRTTRTRWRSTSTSAAGWGSRCCRPTSTSREADFTPVGTDIRFGLTAIRNVGANVVDAIVAARREQGRFTDFADFMDKVPPLVCNKRVIESLVKAGAFDSLGHRRRALVAIHEAAVDQYVDIKRNEAIGQDSLFGGLDDDDGGFGVDVAVPDIDEWDKQTLLGHEREMLGLYVSDHPLLGLEHVLAGGRRLHDRPAAAPTRSAPTARTVTVAGLVTSVQRKITKRGDAWAMVTLEDLEGAIDVLLFPSAYQLASTLLVEDAIVTVKGRLSPRRRTSPSCTARRSAGPGPGAGGPPGRSSITLPSTRCTAAGRRAAQGRAGHPPRRHRGAAAADGPGRHDRDAARRPAAGRRAPGAVSPTSRPCSGPGCLG